MLIGQNPLMVPASFSLPLSVCLLPVGSSVGGAGVPTVHRLTLTDESDADAAVLFFVFSFSA